MEVFGSRESASAHVAEIIAENLRVKLADSDKASLVVSGGSSPVTCYRKLAKTALDWDRVQVTLTDEREVPVTHPESNEKLVRENLLTGLAAGGKFVPLKEGELSSLIPFTCTLVGMGEDGHFASIFPDSPELNSALTSSDEVIKVHTPSSPFARISMTLGTILQSETLILLVFGDKKRKILANPNAYPVSHFLKHTPVTVVWAP